MFRIGLNMRQRDFAARVGVSANYIYLVESGKREPSLSLLKDIARTFDIPISFLFLEEEVKPELGKESKEIYEKLKSLILKVQQVAHSYEAQV